MIAIYYANRAEKSILDPIVSQFKKKNIDFIYINLSDIIFKISNDKNLSRVYDYVYNQIEEYKGSIHSAIVIGDRREIMFVSLALFIKNIPIYQLAAGDLSDRISLVDDYFRHLITILSEKQVCFTEKSLKNSNNLKELLNLKTNSVYYPNPTLSDIEIISKSCKKENYDLVLMHPQSLSKINTINDAKKIKSLLKENKKTLIIKGNKDKNYEILYELWNQLEKKEKIKVFDNLEKEKFIDLLANCDRFITNSSCSFYEAPLFLNEKNIIRIGNRNKNREIATYNFKDIKSSNKIVDFLMEH
jgi:UDP-N-acetylglucosamine 2-epimerase